MSSIDQICVNALRVVGAEMITKAKSGHPGIVLGAAPIAHTLFTKHLNVNPSDEKWFDRDRFVLSAGHGSALLYELLHLSGFDISIDDLKNFRQKGSMTPGHPEYNHTPGIEITTGPLGQGIASACGMAIAEKYLSAYFNKPDFNIVNHYTYVLCGDGDLQEGIAQEAMSLAGHLGLEKLIVLHDSNDVQLDGDVSLANSEDIKMKVEAMGWNYYKVVDGNDCDAISEAINEAKNSDSKPSFIEIKTIIGYGAPNNGESSIHGKPMPEEDIVSLRKFLEYDYEPFKYPDDVVSYYESTVQNRGSHSETEWNTLLKQYQKKYPNEYEEFNKFIFNDFSITDYKDMPKWEVGSKESTRKVMGKILDWASLKLPNLMGGAADLSSSTMVKGADGNFNQANPLGRNIKFGVREHAMAAITNGITLHGGLRGFCSGFFVFSDYLKPAVRLAAIMHLPTNFYFSHDTVCVGEDGPTHQPVEQLTMFRSMPNTNLFRPADAIEMTAAMLESLKDNTYPTVIVSSRQALPNLSCTKAEGVSRGAYVAYVPSQDAKYTIIACGSELSLALEVAHKLECEDIYCTVVSMPSQFLFDNQDLEYKQSVLPNRPTFALEMGSTMSWYKYADVVQGIDVFGSSMPISEIYETYGFTVDQVCENFKKNFLNK